MVFGLDKLRHQLIDSMDSIIIVFVPVENLQQSLIALNDLAEILTICINENIICIVDIYGRMNPRLFSI